MISFAKEMRTGSVAVDWWYLIDSWTNFCINGHVGCHHFTSFSMLLCIGQVFFSIILCRFVRFFVIFFLRFTLHHFFPCLSSSLASSLHFDCLTILYTIAILLKHHMFVLVQVSSRTLKLVPNKLSFPLVSFLSSLFTSLTCKAHVLLSCNIIFHKQIKSAL